MDGDLQSAYYFGCIGEPGHHMHGVEPGRSLESRRAISRFTETNPWGYLIDSGLCPAKKDERQGEAALHHKGGWTALSFWDRSVDSRPGSHSTFLLAGTLDFDDALSRSKAAFPQVFARYRFAVTDGR